MSQPIELYLFEGPTTAYRYTSAAEPVSVGLGLFEPVGIGRHDISASHEDGQNVVTIEVARNNAVALLHRDLPPDTPVRVTIYRMIRGVPTPTVWWRGIVSGVRWSGSVATLECDTLLRAADRPGPRLRFQQQCRWALYSRGCGVDKEAFRDSGTVRSLQPSIKNVGVWHPVQRPAKWYAGGWIESGGRRLLIVRSAEGIPAAGGYTHPLSLAYWAPELALDAPVDVFAGCSHQAKDCNEKFANGDNFGGFLYIPGRNPFDQGVH